MYLYLPYHHLLFTHNANTTAGKPAGALAVKELNNSLGDLSNSLNCKNFTLLGSVSYKSQTTTKEETKDLSDNLSNYKKVLIGLFDGTNIINPFVLTVSEFENVSTGIRVFTDKFQGTITYVSDTTCKFSSFNTIASQRDVCIYRLK